MAGNCGMGNAVAGSEALDSTIADCLRCLSTVKLALEAHAEQGDERQAGSLNDASCSPCGGHGMTTADEVDAHEMRGQAIGKEEEEEMTDSRSVRLMRLLNLIEKLNLGSGNEADAKEYETEQEISARLLPLLRDLPSSPSQNGMRARLACIPCLWACGGIGDIEKEALALRDLLLSRRHLVNGHTLATLMRSLNRAHEYQKVISVYKKLGSSVQSNIPFILSHLANAYKQLAARPYRRKRAERAVAVLRPLIEENREERPVFALDSLVSILLGAKKPDREDRTLAAQLVTSFLEGGQEPRLLASLALVRANDGTRFAVAVEELRDLCDPPSSECDERLLHCEGGLRAQREAKASYLLEWSQGKWPDLTAKRLTVFVKWLRDTAKHKRDAVAILKLYPSVTSYDLTALRININYGTAAAKKAEADHKLYLESRRRHKGGRRGMRGAHKMYAV